MKYYLSVAVFIFACRVSAQNNYYIDQAGDTIKCKFKKIFPREIKVKPEEGKTVSLSPDEVKAFLNEGVFFRTKKINDQKKKPFIFLPDDKVDRRYYYSDPNLSMMSGKGITFFELTEFGGVSPYGGRDVTTTLYIENDSLGLSKVPYMSAVFSNVSKSDVIGALYYYLGTDEAIREKLNENESWKTFNRKGIWKLIAAFMGKNELPE